MPTSSCYTGIMPCWHWSCNNQLLFHPAGSYLFSEGVKEVLALNEQLAVKRHMQSMAKAVLKVESQKPASSASSSSASSQQSGSSKKLKKSFKRKVTSGEDSSNSSPSKRKGSDQGSAKSRKDKPKS